MTVLWCERLAKNNAGLSERAARVERGGSRSTVLQSEGACAGRVRKGIVWFFVDKKWPKAFANLPSGSFNAHGPSEQRFLRRFFQKAAATLNF
jgi:hypothetical protein